MSMAMGALPCFSPDQETNISHRLPLPLCDTPTHWSKQQLSGACLVLYPSSLLERMMIPTRQATIQPLLVAPSKCPPHAALELLSALPGPCDTTFLWLALRAAESPGYLSPCGDPGAEDTGPSLAQPQHCDLKEKNPEQGHLPQSDRLTQILFHKREARFIHFIFF